MSYKNTCVVHTIYALLQYLLLVDDADYKQTLFFVGIDAIDSNVYERLPNYILFNDSRYKSKKRTLWMRIYAALFWRKHIKHTRIFCQDHLYFPSIVINKRNYILLEDGSQIYSRYEAGPLARVEKTKGIIDSIVRAPIYGKTLGRNKQCEKLVYTFEGDASSDIVLSHNSEQIDLSRMWLQANENKRKAINRIFGLDEATLAELKNAEVILLTDSLVTIGVIAEQEQISIYKPYIEQFEGKKIVIKKHPTDIVNYSKYFPNVIECNAYMPMQLLTLNGCKFKYAITMFSTAVSLLDKETKVIWLGNAGNEKIKEIFGECKNPFIK